MTLQAKPSKRVRVQVDLSESEAILLQHLAERLSVRSRADLLQQAYGSFLWVLDEMMAGRKVISVDKTSAEQIDRYRELNISALKPSMFEHYEHLIVRPETGYRQPYLKGRTMRVGQLIYKMRANQLSAEDAANDMDLPIAQVRESQLYYQLNHDLIEQESAEEKVSLTQAGVSVESLTLSR